MLDQSIIIDSIVIVIILTLWYLDELFLGIGEGSEVLTIQTTSLDLIMYSTCQMLFILDMTLLYFRL